MPLEAVEKKYVCSCGSSFIHASTLARHQRLSGCLEKMEQAASEFDTPEFGLEQAVALRKIAEARAKAEPQPVSERFWIAAEFCAWLTEEASQMGRRLKEAARPDPVARAEGIPPRRHLPVLAWIMGVALLVVSFQAYTSNRQAWAEAHAPALRAEDATQTVTDFYRALNGGAYSAAYQQLSRNWRKELSRERFEKGLSRGQKLQWKFLNVQSSEPGQARVDVVLSVDEGRKVLQGYYNLVAEEGAWKLDKVAIWEREGS